MTPVILGALVLRDGIWPLAVFHVFCTTLVAAFLARRNTKAGLVLLGFILVLQPAGTMPLAAVLGDTGVKVFIATKDIFVAAFLSVLFLKNHRRVRWTVVDFSGALFLLVYCFYLLKSSAPLFLRIVSFREGFMIVAYYLCGRLLLFSSGDIRWFLRAVVGIGLLLACFGYVERFGFNENIWHGLGAADYVTAKRPRAGFLGKLPNNWSTYIDGRTVRRMVSTVGESTSLSRFLSLPFLSVLMVHGLVGFPWGSRVILIPLMLILGGALALTLGRGGMAIVLLGVVLHFLSGKRKYVGIVFIPLLLVVALRSTLFDMNSASVTRHLVGLAKVEHILHNPLGYGLGSSGQMAVSYSLMRVDEKVSESYVASLGYQAGVPGLLCYALFFITLAWSTFRCVGRPMSVDTRGISLLSLSLCAGIFATSLLANSAVAPISCGLSLALCGMNLSLHNTRPLTRRPQPAC